MGSIPSLRQGRDGLGVNLGHPAAHSLNPLAVVDAANISHIDKAGAVGKAIHHIAVDIGGFHLTKAALDSAEHEHDLGDTLVGGKAQGRRAGFQHIVLGGGKAVCQGLIRHYIVSTTKAAYKVFLLWCLLIATIGVLYYFGVLDKINLFMISVLFYVCDLICVLVWCPFRLVMKNRCCTTCRIFNWDHLMMFSPLIFMGGFYAGSLVLMAALAWLVWELCVMMYPERFWDHSNEALKCSECTDKLCTQYCHKLRT